MFAFLTHHIVSDAWSIALFVKDLSILYNAFVRNQNCPIEDLPFLYCDFANWQQSELRGTKLGRKIDFWIEKLAGSLPVLELPTDRPRPAVQTHNGTSYVFSI